MSGVLDPPNLSWVMIGVLFGGWAGCTDEAALPDKPACASTDWMPQDSDAPMRSGHSVRSMLDGLMADAPHVVRVGSSEVDEFSWSIERDGDASSSVYAAGQQGCPEGRMVEVPVRVALDAASGIEGAGTGFVRAHEVTGEVWLAWSVVATGWSQTFYETLVPPSPDCPGSLVEMTVSAGGGFVEDAQPPSLAGGVDGLFEGADTTCRGTIARWSRSD